MLDNLLKVSVFCSFFKKS